MMKTICFLLIVSFSVLQPKASDPVEHTIALLKQSTWAELYKTLAPSVDLTILIDNDMYAKEQAQGVLNNFFVKNQPFTIKLIHRVDSNPDYKYAVVLMTGKNGSFRTSFSVRNNNGTFQLNELHIELENLK